MTIKIDLQAKCDYCEKSESDSIEYTTASISQPANFLKQLRHKGWQIRYDQNYKLALTICPSCAKKR